VYEKARTDSCIDEALVMVSGLCTVRRSVLGDTRQNQYRGPGIRHHGLVLTADVYMDLAQDNCHRVLPHMGLLQKSTGWFFLPLWATW
jgi:hypothetical protein